MKGLISLVPLCFLSVVLLASCSSPDDSSTKPESQNSVTSEEKSTNTQSNQDENNEENTNSENRDSKTVDVTSKENKDDIANQLKMENDFVKLPGAFPVNGDIEANIIKDTSSTYTIDYQTGSGEELATFTGTLYASAIAAKDNLNKFMSGKEVPKNNETETDLGHGIKGYGEGAAGHAYFGWKEGNWVMSISSISEDQMNHPAIAQKMVDYLETHSLPAPKDTGIVSVDYPKGGNSVNVDIRWQENSMVYQLETSKVPLDALKMATSVE